MPKNIYIFNDKEYGFFAILATNVSWAWRRLYAYYKLAFKMVAPIEIRDKRISNS